MSEKDAPISQENKLVARHVAVAFGGTPRVDEYINDSDSLAIGILYCRDRPEKGVTSYSTIKLSDHPIKRDAQQIPNRLELAGLCKNTFERFGNVLASAAFTIMQSDAVYGRGTVMPNLVCQHDPSSKLPHLYLTAPPFWKQAPQMLDCGTKQVGWLLAVPISESEHGYLKAHGEQALERLFETQQIDFTDPARTSAVRREEDGDAP